MSPKVERPRASGAARRSRVGLQAGNAADFIQSVDQLKPGTRVIACARKSNRERRRLEGQVAELKSCLINRDLTVINVHTFEGSGWDPTWLMEAAVEAKKNDAVLVAECPNRFIRNRRYRSCSKSGWKAQATQDDLEELRFCTQGVALATVLRPDATPEEERAVQTKRGQRASGKKGGRPRAKFPGYKKRIREQKKPTAIEMRKEGASLGEIATTLGVPRSTVQDWLK